MPNPMKKKVLYLFLENVNRDNTKKLSNNTAVDEWYINENENLLIIKFDKDKISEEEIQEILK